jgi:transcription elongation factor SPT5
LQVLYQNNFAALENYKQAEKNSMDPTDEKHIEENQTAQIAADQSEEKASPPASGSGGADASDSGSLSSGSSDDDSSGSDDSDSDSASDSGSSSGSDSGSDSSDSGSEDSEDEEEEARPVKRKTGGSEASKKKRFRFLDVEADVGSSDEEDEDFIDDDAAAREAREGARESRELELLRREAEQRRKTGGGNRLQSVIQRLEERAARQPAGGETTEGPEAAIVPVDETDEYFGEGEFANAAAASMALFPTSDDFKLFFVRMAEPGKEREAVIQLSHKAAEEMRNGKDCQIRSVFAVDSLRGYIYVEAPNDTVAKNFLMGIRKVQWYNLTVVPQSEMASVFKAAIEDSNERFKQLQPGEFVRIKRHAVYKGDLARVVESYDRDVEVELVPRIDWLGSRQQATSRPAQSLFDDRVIEGLGVGEVERLRNPSTGEVRNHYRNEVFNDGGFVVKRLSRQALLAGDDVNPKISELRWFPKSDSPRKKNASALAIVADTVPQIQQRSVFSIGDIVRVTTGDMKNLVGRISLIDKSGVVSLDPQNAQGVGLIQILSREIEKNFKLSDHVEILDGPSSGDTGIITAIAGSVCTILIDEELRDVKVNINSLKMAPDMSKGEMKLGGYMLGQLVHFSKPIDSIGVIVRISKSGNFTLLGVDGKKYSMTLGDIVSSKSGGKDILTVSRHGDQIRKGAVVKYFDERSQVKTGTVREIYRSSIFVRENEKVEDSGLSVVDAKNVEVVSTSSARQAPSVMTNIAGAANNTAPTHQQVAYRRPGQSRLEGKRVRIIKGQYKGQLAQVREDHDTRVQVSLEAKFRVVTIPKDCVRLEDEELPEPSANSGEMGSLSQPPPSMMGSLSQPPPGYVPPSSTPYTPAPPHLRGPH